MVAGVRLPLAAVAAAAVVFLLFRLMHMLIAMSEMSLDDDARNDRIEFVRIKQDTRAQQRKRELPQKQKPKTPPKTPEMDKADTNSAAGTSVSVGTPDIDADLDLGDGLNLNTTVADSEEVPIVRVEPIYPRRAAEQMIEGWVTLQFDISTTGATTNVKVIDSQPKRIFDRAAERAVSKWKYRPKIVDGKALVTKNVKVKLTFKLGG